MTKRINCYDPFAIGFNSMFSELENIVENKYPPYNILDDGKEKYKIELAVAGFSKDDITIDIKNRKLNIFADKKEDANKKYIHRGISSKSFARAFVLAEHVEIKSAKFVDGILTISLERNIPEDKLSTRVLIE